MQKFIHELTTALRQLRRAPGFAALAIVMLALGIGVNVAIFSVLQTIVLSPLPYPEPDRLVGFSAINGAKALRQPALSVADFRDFRERSTACANLAAYRPDFVGYAPQGADPVQLVCGLVTEEFFPVFGVAPLLGRPFRAEEFAGGAASTALLSFNAWRRHFAQDPAVLGRTVMLNEQPTTIVGVMPADFREPDFVDVWLPFSPEAPENLVRDSRYWTTVGRLKPGVTLAAAQAEATTTAAALEGEYSTTNRGWTVALQPLREMRTGGVRSSLFMLVGAVGLVLLVACVNLANLMLARGVARMPELAVRLALGASSGRLARAVLLESLLLALAGGLLGAGLVALGLPLLAQQLPPGLVPRAHEIGVSGSALAFALVVSVATGVVFGSLPAWQVLRANVNELLKAGGARGQAGGFATRAQSGLIIGQVALTLVVLTGAGLLMKSLLLLSRADPGFDPRHVLTLRIAPGQDKWSDFTALSLYYERVLGELRRVPGVESVSLNSSAPLTGITLRYPFWVQGRPRSEGNSDEAVFNSVDPDYFRTLRVPLRQGRTFEARDDEQGAAVCLVNAALAQRLFPNESPLGKRLQLVPWLNRNYREIVGVVGDVKQDTQADVPMPQIYVPLRQSPWFFAIVLVRTDGNVTTGALQAAVRRADPALTMTIRTMDEAIARTAAQPRLRAALFGVFGALALGLSAFGIYASMAFSVSQRRREIGVRMALGASPAEILGWVLGRAGRLTAWGVLLGLAGAAAFSLLLRSLLYGVAPADPLVLATLAVFLPLVALASTFAPAWRASRLNPTQALQQE
ncbi:MAG: ABC transporter permease [Opitutae bacterium]|nr:ABC transporter permease [Opitutae bacterium]